MEYIKINDKNYIDGGKLELISGEKILVLLDPKTFYRHFIGYKIDEGILTYYNLSSEILKSLDIINTIEYMPHDWMDLSNEWAKAIAKLKKIAYKGTIILLTTTAFFASADLILKHTTPYTGATITDYVLSKFGSAVQVKVKTATDLVDKQMIEIENNERADTIIKNIRDKRKDSPYKKDYEEFVIPYIQQMVTAFPNINMPFLENLENLEIEKYDFEKYKKINKGKTQFISIGWYNQSLNKIFLPNDEVLQLSAKADNITPDEEMREIGFHEVNHANQVSFLSRHGFRFGEGLYEGAGQLVVADVLNFKKGFSCYSLEQTVAKILQELIGPEVIAKYNFSCSPELIINNLAKITGNELDACKFISSVDNYCFFRKEATELTINSNTAGIDILDQILVYEEAKIKKDIQTGVYPNNNAGMQDFVRQLYYLDNCNCILLGLSDSNNTEDYNKLDQFSINIKKEYGQKYGEELIPKINKLYDLNSIGYYEKRYYNPVIGISAGYDYASAINTLYNAEDSMTK